MYSKILLLVLAFPSVQLFATNYIVKQDGTGDYVTIQDAINNAKSGDSVLVSTGEYKELLTIYKSLTLLSMYGPDSTIINGDSSGDVIKLDYTIDVNINGFTIKNGDYGIYYYGQGHLYLKNMIFTQNISGMNLPYSTTVENALIYNNTGELLVIGTSNTPYNSILKNVTIIGNNNFKVRLQHQAATGDTSTYMDMIFFNSIIMDDDGFNLHYQGENSGAPRLFVVTSLLTFEKWQILNDNPYGIVNLDEKTLSLIKKKPLFQNPEANDYRLSKNSPAIGAGVISYEINGTTVISPLSDLDGNSRPDPSGSNPDVGAYESLLGEPLPITKYIVKLDGIGNFNSIQAAIDSASSGDTVLVYSGTYNENLTIDSKGIALISEYGSDSTIIDGGGNGTVLTINNVFDRIDSSSVINGFTLKNGSADNLTNGELSGGGIHFRSGSLVFNDLVVENNYADGFGGGVCVINVEKAIFNNCIVRSNYSGVGCGLHLIGTQLELNNVLVVGNEGTGRGTSVLLSGYGNDKTHVLNHVTITGNLNTGEAIYTSGLYLGGGNVTILNSIIEGNEHGSIGINENTHNEKITIANSVIKRGSTDGTYGGIGDIQINEIGDNNYILDTSNVYDYDPLFHDPENADYTLSDFSPIIGKGLEFLDVSWGSKPFTKTILPLPVDLMGNKRPNPTGSYPDIGAYESVYSSRSPKANTISDGLSDTLEMDFSNATNTLSAHWKTFDDDGTITYEYAIGTNTLNNVVDWTSNGTDTSVTVTGLTLVNGETYFFSVRGTDNNGQVSDTASTDGVFIDNEIPVINTIYESPGVFINQSIQFGPDSSNIGLAHLIDNNLSSETSGAMTVEFWIKHDQGSIAYNLNPFYGKFFRVMFVQMQGIDYAGVIVGKFQFHWINENGNDDWLDMANLVFNKWNHYAITRNSSFLYKIYHNGIYQGEVQGYSSSTMDPIWEFGIQMGWEGKGNLDEIRFWNYERSENDINASMYKGMKGNESGLVAYYDFNEVWTDTIYDKTGNGNHAVFMAEGHGIPYIQDTWQTDFDDSLIDLDWYGPGQNGKIILIANDNLGISKYEFCVGTSIGIDDVIPWFSRDSSIAEIDLFTMSEGTTYYTSGKVTDIVGNQSDFVSTDGFQMDLTEPTPGSVIDGLTEDIDYQTDTTVLRFSWNGFSDTGSGLDHYYYVIGTTPGSSNLIGQTYSSPSNNSVILENLDLDPNVTYYITVYGVDLVGNEAYATSDGITIDLAGPSGGAIIDGLTTDSNWSNNTDSLQASWTGFKDPNGIEFYEVALGIQPKFNDVVDWIKVGLDSSYTFTGLSLSDGNTYNISVRATDGLGNVSEPVSSNGITVDITPPSISSTTLPDDRIPVFENRSIEFTPTEIVTSVTVKVSSAQRDTIDYNFSLGEDNKITMNINAPFTGGDKLTVNLDNLTDRSGLITSGVKYAIDIAYLADYNIDESVDISDLTELITGWIGNDLQYELGPASGVVPYLKPAIDGEFDIYDAAVFTRMWHWSLNTNNQKRNHQIAHSGADLSYIYRNKILQFILTDKITTIELFLTFPPNECTINLLTPDTSEKNIILTALDTMKGEFLLNAGYWEHKKRVITLPLTFKGQEETKIQVFYRMYNQQFETFGQGWKEIKLDPVPNNFALHENYPNPFNPVTNIRYELPVASKVLVNINDLLGREVITLVNKIQPEGYYEVRWEGKDQMGNQLGSGIYFYTLQARSEEGRKQFRRVKKMVLLK